MTEGLSQSRWRGHNGIAEIMLTEYVVEAFHITVGQEAESMMGSWQGQHTHNNLPPVTYSLEVDPSSQGFRDYLKQHHRGTCTQNWGL